ncbi:hypothetical protein [Rathayibacter tanaceti]|uniref:Secreted protein n=2 Tax=Rathayibacter tanaceti TaxID=1671680 RepID=A0A166HG30_9MICO|nr:hypothetical protein [Rathayibacter tanaceti]KZX20532.1 hypothetical protein ACH61_02358 [Rathayibacter tanaceti]QHC54511.1 hypothetical protein GSU10_01775 [Rathayibacter tanaceti]TCO32952.1 hypothetical protein EV639_1167 [Rathayibacter tanaceti]
MKKRSKAVFATFLAIGLVANLAPAANGAEARYGEARCSGSVEPTSGSVGPGTVVHQIGPGVGYYEKTYNNGNVSAIRWFQIGEDRAMWATISQTFHVTSWLCRDQGLYAN